MTAENAGTSNETIGPTGRALLGAAALGWLFDYLFYGRALGVSVPLFASVAALSAAAVAGGAGRPPSRWQSAAGAGALLFSACAAWRAAPELVFADLAAAAALFALFLSPWLLGRRIEDFEETDFVESPRDVLVESIARGNEQLRRTLSGAKAGGKGWGAAAAGVAVAVPLLALFLALMVSADLVFRSLFSRLLSLFDPISALAQGGLIGAVAGLALGAASWLRKPRASSPSAWGLAAAAARAGAAEPWGFVQANVAAGLVNALLAAFALVQAVFLLGGKERIAALGTGVTYSEYARQGFWQMLLIGALAIALSLALDEKAPAETPSRLRIKKANILAACLSTGVMLISAAYRLWLYEEAYGFTVLRFYSHCFTGYLALVFLLLGAKVVGGRTRGAFLRDAAVAALGLLAAWNVANPHARIAEANLDRQERQLQALDVSYLTRLSDDALPVLVRAVGAEGRPDVSSALEHHLSRRRARLRELQAGDGWPALHWARTGGLLLLDGWTPRAATAQPPTAAPPLVSCPLPRRVLAGAGPAVFSR